MAHLCIVKSCPNTRVSVKQIDEHISFFHLPEAEVMRKKWLERIGEVKTLNKPGYARICSVHFTKESFSNPECMNMTIADRNNRRRHLLPDAVPSVKLNPNDARSKRISGRGKKEQAGQRRTICAKETIKGGEARSENLNRSLKRNAEECHREEAAPTRKSTRLFVNEKSNTDTRDDRLMSNEEDSAKLIQWLNEKISRLQSLGNSDGNTNTDDQEEIGRLRAQCAAYALELKKEHEAKKKMFAEIKELKKSNNELYTKLKSAGIEQSESEEKNVKVHSILKPYFTEGQICCIIEGRKWVKWSVNDYAAAIALRSVSPKAYRYLRNKLNFPLPSLSLLRTWVLTQFDISEGFLTDVLEVMREKSKDLSPMERIAVITFDEMPLTPEICFDAQSEQMAGPCNKVQVIMVRGLFGNWKQPIYYKFDQPMTKSILNTAISLLDQAGYQVVAFTCDMSNNLVWRELGITIENHYFPHPTIEDAVVYAFADVPHLLKLLRNWCIDDGFHLRGCNQKFTYETLRTIVDKTVASDLCVTHRLTQRVLDARQTMAQAVWPAARIWSRSVANTVEWMGKRNLLGIKEYRKFSDFILTVNDWFDVHNSQMKYGKHEGVNAFGVNINNQNKTLVLMSSYIESLRVGERKRLMPFQEGIIISNASLRSLHEALEEKFPNDYEYILTRKLQQDVLANFFSCIRAMGATRDDPSGHDFKYRLRWYVLGKHPHTVVINNKNMEEACIPVRYSISTAAHESSSSSFVAFHAGASNDYGSQTRYDISESLQNCSASSITNIAGVDCSSEPAYEYEPDPDTEIVMTEELFMEIINISPDPTTDNIEDDLNSQGSGDDDLYENPQRINEIDDVKQVDLICQESCSLLDVIDSNNCIH